jgi:hypothetical protein
MYSGEQLSLSYNGKKKASALMDKTYSLPLTTENQGIKVIN